MTCTFPTSAHKFKALCITKNEIHSPLLISSIDLIDKSTAHIKWLNYDSKEQSQSLNNEQVFILEERAESHFDLTEDESYEDFEVYNGDKKLGIVSSIFENNFQETLEIELDSGKKLLIPFIDEYVSTIDEYKKIIYTQVTEDFITMFSS